MLLKRDAETGTNLSIIQSDKATTRLWLWGYKLEQTRQNICKSLQDERVMSCKTMEIKSKNETKWVQGNTVWVQRNKNIYRHTKQLKKQATKNKVTTNKTQDDQKSTHSKCKEMTLSKHKMNPKET